MFSNIEMTHAKLLVDDLQEELKTAKRDLRQHPYLAAFREGAADVSALVPLLGHKHHILKAFVSLGPRLRGRIPPRLVGPFLYRMLQGTDDGTARLLVMAGALGLSQDDLEAYQPSAEGFAQGAYLNLLFNDGSPAEVTAALLVNLPSYAFNAREIGWSLREIYGWPSERTAFVDYFATLPPLEGELLPVIQAGLEEGVAPASIKRAVRLYLGYDQLFWNALARAAGDSLTAQAQPRIRCA